MTDGSSESVGVLTTDRALVVRSWDAWLVRATGIPEATATGRPLAELIPDLEERGLLARLRRVADEGVPVVLAPAFHHYLVPCAPLASSAHFTRMQQHVTVSPLRAAGAHVGVVVTIEDVTARLDRERTLAAELRSQDEGIRLRAARALASEERPTPTLADALGDGSWRVRRVAAEGLARGEDAVAALLDAIRDRHRDPAVLNAALTGLAQSRHDVLPGVSALLRSEDADVRTYAALALGLLADRRGVPVLVGAIADAEPNVRFHAIEALGRIGHRDGVEPLLAVAESRDFYLAFPALDALASIGDPSVAERLLPLLEDDLLRDAVVAALGRLGSEDMVAPLARLLERPDAAAGEIARALATLYARVEEGYGEGRLVADLACTVITPEGARRLVDAVPRATDEELEALVLVIGWIEFEGIIGVLARMLEHPAARPLAAEALARRGSAAVDALLRLLAGDGDDEARKAAAAALGRIGSARATPALVALLDDAPEVAIVAAGAVGSIGDRTAFEPLLAMLDRPEASVRHAMIAALNSLGHPEMPRHICALLVDDSPRVRESAARIAGYFGYGECLDPLLSLCRDGEDEPVRRAAVEQLVHFDDARARQMLHDALGAPSPAIRAAVARALAQAEAPDALPMLLEAAHDDDPWVRYYAARSAGHLGATEVIPMLEELATSVTMPPIRIAAVDALGEIGAADAAPTLVQLSDDPMTEVARAALLSLGRLPHEAADAPLREALRAADPARQLAALESLRHRPRPSAVPEVRHLASVSDDPHVRSLAITVLGGIGTADAVDALLDLAGEPRYRAEATAALSRVPRVGSLEPGLRHPEPWVRCAVVEALARTKHRDASQLLAVALDDDVSAVRLAAAQALGRLDLPAVKPRLSTLAREDEDQAVRQAARDALTR